MLLSFNMLNDLVKLRKIVWGVVFLSICMGGVLICFSEKAVIIPEPFFEERYAYDYPDDFFKYGGQKITYNPRLHLKIGIVVRNHSRMHITEIIRHIFSVAPLERYRHFFVFLDYRDIRRITRLKNSYIDAYNAYGSKVPGGYDIGSSSVRAGLKVLRVDDYEFTKTGTLGYARGKVGVAQKMTILHELGHLLAHLGDEYSRPEESAEQKELDFILESLGVGLKYRKFKVWRTEHANIDYRSHKVLKWHPLIEQ